MTTLTDKESYRIGLVSDTHGTVSETLAGVFSDVDLIVHAGDIGKSLVIDQLQKIAPVVAVRGNVDHGSWAFSHNELETVQAGDIRICLVHNLEDLERDWKDKYQCIVYGHTHEPHSGEKENVFFVNPGSASNLRLAPTAAVLSIQRTAMDVAFFPV